ncbi:MAG TPA: alpha/beta hydrolase family protein [Microthrixaceae bacterium]|nr:alpha/beta hydrolase family protein [Microthrixaceae bacterium]
MFVTALTRRPRRAVFSLALVLGLAMLASCSPAPPAPKVVHEAALEVLSTRHLTDRLVELDVRSAAVGRTQLRVMLPVGFEANPDRSYPTLFLLHGGSGNYEEWTSEPKGVTVGSSLEQATASYDMLVVMPDGGPGATFLNWLYPNPLGGRPQYETYHLNELPALLRTQFRANGRSAIAGLSAGGFGAGSYAARHPDMFDAMASFSGNLDTRDDDVGEPWKSAVPTYFLEHTYPLGDPLTQEVRWRGHNPLDLAPNLAHTSMYVAGGDGRLGPLDPPPSLADFPWLSDFLTLEETTLRRSKRFVNRLGELNIPVVTHFYGRGTHSGPYWRRELSLSLPMLAKAMEQNRPTPESFTYRSTENSFDVWGWHFEVRDRREPAFTDITVTNGRVSATGNGTLDATAPATWPAGAGTGAGIRFTLDLGGTAERYSSGPDRPGPRPTGPPAVFTAEG